MPRAAFGRPLLLLAAVAALGLPACGRRDGGEAPSNVIQNKGSDTMVNVAQVWAESSAPPSRACWAEAARKDAT